MLATLNLGNLAFHFAPLFSLFLVHETVRIDDHLGSRLVTFALDPVWGGHFFGVVVDIVSRWHC